MSHESTSRGALSLRISTVTFRPGSNTSDMTECTLTAKAVHMVTEVVTSATSVTAVSATEINAVWSTLPGGRYRVIVEAQKSPDIPFSVFDDDVVVLDRL
jgi:hypothetical protein